MFCMLASSQSVCHLQRLTLMVLFSGLAAEVHYQSGFAPSPAGFHQTPPHTSHSKHHLEVTEPQQLPVSHGGSLGDVGQCSCSAQLHAAISADAAVWRSGLAPVLVECSLQASQLARGNWLIIGIHVTVQLEPQKDFANKELE